MSTVEVESEEVETVLKGLEASLSSDHPTVLATRPALIQKLRELVEPARDRSTGKTADEMLRTEPWLVACELSRWGKRLTSATCSLIEANAHLIDEDHPAKHILDLIEDHLIETAEQMKKAAYAIDPEAAAAT